MRPLSLSRFSRLTPDNSATIQAVRGGAAIAVFLTHIEQVFLAPVWPHLFAFSRLIGQVAVMAFFVLSGFLIAKSITSKTATGTYSFTRYAADRAWRILPPFLFACALMITLYAAAPSFFASQSRDFGLTSGYLVAPGYYLPVKELIGSALFLNGFIVDTPRINGPLWSLSFEVWFYVVAGLAVHFRKSKSMLTLLAAAFLAMSVLNSKFLVYSIVWCAGFVVCLLHNNQALLARMRVTLKACGLLAIAVALPLAVAYAHSVRTSIVSGGNWHFIVLFDVVVGLAMACLLALILDHPSRSIPVLEDSAGYAYTLYIVHFPIILFVFGVFQVQICASHKFMIATCLFSFIGTAAFSRSAAKLLESRSALSAMLSRFASD